MPFRDGHRRPPPSFDQDPRHQTNHVRAIGRNRVEIGFVVEWRVDEPAEFLRGSNQDGGLVPPEEVVWVFRVKADRIISSRRCAVGAGRDLRK